MHVCITASARDIIGVPSLESRTPCIAALSHDMTVLSCEAVPLSAEIAIDTQSTNRKYRMVTENLDSKRSNSLTCELGEEDWTRSNRANRRDICPHVAGIRETSASIRPAWLFHLSRRRRNTCPVRHR